MKKKRTVWVVMHYEYIGFTDSPWIDALQFHVSSTFARAEKYIRSAVVGPHSWWQIHPHTVDSADDDEGEEVYYYSHRGTRLKSAPHTRAKAAFHKLAAQHPDQYPNFGSSNQV